MKKLTYNGIVLLTMMLFVMACQDDALQSDGDFDNLDSEINSENDNLDSESPPDMFPLSIKCWQHGSDGAIESEHENEKLMTACNEADSGHSDYICRATNMKFKDDGMKYGVQCEAEHKDYDGLVCLDVDYGWLGPEYGNLTNDVGCSGKATGLPDGYYCGCLTGSIPNLPPNNIMPTWSDELIDDVLAHDIINTTCEEITDYRQCVRSFIPPVTHCMPVFSFPWDFNKDRGDNSECCEYDGELFWLTAKFFGCVARLEPNNTVPTIQKSDDWLDGIIRNTTTGECLSITDPVPPRVDWEKITDTSDCK